MSPNKNMEELLASARELPTELTYDEVEFLFLHPTPPPPAQPWWRGGYLKFLLMLTLIISLLGFLLPTQADVVDYQISAFPVQEETPALTEASTFLPAQPITELTLPSPNYPMPQVQPPV